MLTKEEMRLEEKIRKVFNRRLKIILAVKKKLDRLLPELSNSIELKVEKRIIESIRNEIYDIFLKKRLEE